MLDTKAKQVQNEYRKALNPTKEYSPAMEKYREYLRSGEAPCVESAIAFEIHKDRIQREIVEALLIGQADLKEVEEHFCIPVASLEMYKELFFDTDKFSTKLSKISYLENYDDRFGKELKIRAVNLGPEYVYYTYANIVPKSSKQRSLVMRMFMSTAYKAMAMNYNGMNTSISDKALSYGKLMLKCWEALQRFSEEDLGEDVDLIKVLTKEPSMAAPDKGKISISRDDII